MRLSLAVVLVLATGLFLSAAEADPAEAGGEPSPADGAAVDPAELSVTAAYYGQNDDGGIPQVDETARVFETLILLDVPVGEHDRVQGRALADVVSAASIKRNHNPQFRSLQSGASGNYRVGLRLGWDHELSRDLATSLAASWADEYAYRSLGVSGGTTWELAGGNTTLDAGLDAWFDTVTVIRYSGAEEGDEARTTVTLDLGWTQLLTSRSLGRLEYSHTEQRGFLETSYNSVFLFDTWEFAENLKRRRSRDAVALRYKLALDGLTSLEAGGRLYTDSWGIDAATLDLRLFRTLVEDRWLLEARYRLHRQTAADDYHADLGSLPHYRTQDPDLGAFTSHLVGLHLSWLTPTWGDWSLGLSWMTRDNGLDMFWTTLGFSRSF